MGEMYKIACPRCGYETTLYLGAGFMSVNLRRSASILPEREQAVLLKMIDESEVKKFNICNRVTECPECRIIDSHTIIDIIANDGTERRFGTKCNICKSDTIVYEDGEDKEYICPKCGQGILKPERTGVWD